MGQEAQGAITAGSAEEKGQFFLSHLLTFILLVGLFSLLRLSIVPGLPVLNLSQLQMIFFPLVLLFLWRARVTPVGVPVQLLLVVAVCGFLSIWFVHTVFSTVSGAFHVARLAGDPFEKHSRIFREELNKYLAWDTNVRAHRYWDSIGSAEEAAGVLREEEDVRVLIWGDRERLRVSFGDLQYEPLGSLLERSADSPLFDMQFVTRIPLVELPFGPENAVREYLARLLSGISPVLREKVYIPHGMGMRHELDLRTAARVVSSWRTEDHRGLAWWILANNYVRKALADPTSMQGYFDCASRAYSVAANYVSRSDSPELFAAIHNNYAALLLLRRVLGIGRSPMRNAQKSFMYALSAERFQEQQGGNLQLFLLLRANVARYELLREAMRALESKQTSVTKVKSKSKKKSKSRRQKNKRTQEKVSSK